MSIITKDNRASIEPLRKAGWMKYITTRVLSQKQIESLKRGAASGAAKFRSPEVRAKAIDSMRKTYALGNWKRKTPEEYSRIGKLARSKVNPQNMLKANRKLGEARRGRRNPPGRSEIGENHWHSKEWAFKSPAGVLYRFKNLSEFVRTHSDLFDPEDAEFKRHRSRASHGLSTLYSKDGKNCSWKGWTAVAFEERDYLGRVPISNQSHETHH